MLGHIMEWFYRGLLGIDQTKNSVAFKEIMIKPVVVGDVTSAKGSYETMYGTISTDWKKQDTSFRLKVTIPANTTAVVCLPATKSSKIFEGNKLLKNVKDIKFLGIEKGKAKLKIGSGSYSFVINN